MALNVSSPPLSEETGQISIVRNGILSHNLSSQELRKRINEYLFETGRSRDKEPVLVETLENEQAPALKSTKAEPVN